MNETTEDLMRVLTKMSELRIDLAKAIKDGDEETISNLEKRIDHEFEHQRRLSSPR